ncbi:MAG: EAL domain-containing protein, partial [Syntrophomonadaceae bacterium]
MLNSIRVQTLLILVLLFVAEIILINAVLGTVMISRIDLMEQRDVEEYLAKSSTNLGNILNNMDVTASDWAIWDSTYKYIQGQNNDFVTENLPDDTLGTLNLNFMGFINNQGEVVLSRQYDESNGHSVATDPEIIQFLQGSPVISNKSPDFHMKGLFRLPNGLMLVASCPIMPSSVSREAAGNLVIGRYLHQAEINNLAADLRVNLTIDPVDNLSPDDRSYLSQLTLDNPTMVKIADDDIITGYALLPDISGQPAGLLKIDVPREISRIGNNGIKYVVRYTLIAFLLSILIVMAFLDRRILNRLAVMSRELEFIGSTTNKRLKTDRNKDEIALVSDSINDMLDKEQHLYQALQEAHDELENKVLDRTAALNMANASLQEEMRKREEIQDKITHLAYHDYLTDLPNRLLFTELLCHAMSMSKRLGKVLAILFLDLDGFKNINDTMGHYAGDWLLKEVAARLVQCIRSSDTIARLGGDEFIIMIENLSDLEGVGVFAGKILHAFEEPFVLQNQICHVTTSIGIAVYPADGEDADTLIKNADIAMYQAKEKGKNQFAFCTSNMKEYVVENMRLSNHLYRAIEKNELEVYYQPQVNCQTCEIVGVEALLRWHHPTEGTVSPGVFIPIAEQTGLINNIGEWVLQQACAQNQTWQQAGLPKLRVAVNVSVKQLHNANFVETVEHALNETGMDPEFLEIEITESAIMKDHHSVSDVLAALKQMGVKIAIDDFGTEYSSLNYIKTMPVD